MTLTPGFASTGAVSPCRHVVALPRPCKVGSRRSGGGVGCRHGSCLALHQGSRQSEAHEEQSLGREAESVGSQQDRTDALTPPRWGAVVVPLLPQRRTAAGGAAGGRRTCTEACPWARKRWSPAAQDRRRHEPRGGHAPRFRDDAESRPWLPGKVRHKNMVGAEVRERRSIKLRKRGGAGHAPRLRDAKMRP